MSHLPKVMHAMSRLLSYPEDQTLGAAEMLYVVLQDEVADAARDAAAFGAFVEQHELWEVEEAFTRTFDINPACALEVGWHLFGEEYSRGMFLVRMREELRKYDLPESVELPDHISHVLAVVAAMPEDEATRFVRACVQPAVEKMKQALAGKETPYRHVVGCLSSILKHQWGDPVREETAAGPSQPPAGDPLRAFPVAADSCGCEASCGGPVDQVPQTFSSPAYRPDIVQLQGGRADREPQEVQLPILTDHTDRPASDPTRKA